MLENLEQADLFPKIPKGWIIVAVGLGIVYAGLWVTSCLGRHQVTAHVQQADQQHIVAAAQAAQGEAHDQDVAARQPQLQDDADQVARLRAEVARLRRPAPSGPGAPSMPEPEPVVPPSDLVAVVAKQDLLIAAQDKLIQDQGTQILSLTLARDSWKASSQAGAAEAVQLRSAMAAQQGLAKSQRWLGRVEGLGFGLAVGYVGGRLH
jgi:hypothetical protein